VPIDDFQVSLAASETKDLAQGRIWQVGPHAIRRIAIAESLTNKVQVDFSIGGQIIIGPKGRAQATGGVNVAINDYLMDVNLGLYMGEVAILNCANTDAANADTVRVVVEYD
jgi:hypothetical protein